MTENENQETSRRMMLLTIALAFGFAFSTAAMLISVYQVQTDESYTIWVVISTTSATVFYIVFGKTVSKLPQAQ